MANWKEVAKQTGALKATECLLSQGIDLTRQVEVFDLVEASGIWLVFGELDGALGVFKREGSTTGIMINNRRPRSVQRMTAAHEFGHFMLGHNWSVDGTTEIDGFSQVRQEIEAQAFALDFLMPLQLVEACWDQLKLPAETSKIEAHQVYLLATSMGVSYIACVIQLRAMEKLTLGESKALLQYTPKKAKQALGAGVAPVDPWADVWPVEQSDSGRDLAVRLRDEIRIKLSESPSTGYRWELDAESAGFFSITGDEFEGADLFAVGAGGHRFLSIRADQPGLGRLVLSLRRAWASVNTSQSFLLNVTVNENEFGGERTGVRRGVQEQLLLGVAD